MCIGWHDDGLRGCVDDTGVVALVLECDVINRQRPSDLVDSEARVMKLQRTKHNASSLKTFLSASTSERALWPMNIHKKVSWEFIQHKVCSSFHELECMSYPENEDNVYKNPEHSFTIPHKIQHTDSIIRRQASLTWSSAYVKWSFVGGPSDCCNWIRRTDNSTIKLRRVTFGHSRAQRWSADCWRNYAHRKQRTIIHVRIAKSSSAFLHQNHHLCSSDIVNINSYKQPSQ